MRISDWSSDVCSSDLVDGPKTQTECHEGRRGWPTHGVRRAAASRRDDESVVNESGAHSTADRLLTVQRRAVHQALAVERIVVGTEIGRATGREEVDRYV